MDTTNANLGRILLTIYFWESRSLSIDLLVKYTKLSRKIICKITKACRLIAANFMVANPNLNKIGGYGKDGKPIIVQIDESATGRNKHHCGATRVQTGSFGGIEDPDQVKCQSHLRLLSQTGRGPH